MMRPLFYLCIIETGLRRSPALQGAAWLGACRWDLQVRCFCVEKACSVHAGVCRWCCRSCHHRRHGDVLVRWPCHHDDGGSNGRADGDRDGDFVMMVVATLAMLVMVMRMMLLLMMMMMTMSMIMSIIAVVVMLMVVVMTLSLMLTCSSCCGS